MPVGLIFGTFPEEKKKNNRIVAYKSQVQGSVFSFGFYYGYFFVTPYANVGDKIFTTHGNI